MNVSSEWRINESSNSRLTKIFNKIQNVEVSNLCDEAANWKQRKLNKVQKAGNKKLFLTINYKITNTTSKGASSKSSL